MWNLNKYIYESKEQLLDKSDFDFFSVTNNQWLILSEKRVSEDTSKYKILKNNYFAYNPYRINVWSIWIFKWEKWAVSPAYVVFYVDETKIFPDLLFLLLKSNYFILEINKNTKWSVRDALSFNKFKNIDFTFPEDIEEQKRLFKKLESINNKIEKIKLSKEKNNIKILREQILKQAIEWKLVSQNPNDEPASILLEKIKQEKEKLIKEWKLKKEKELPKITKDEIPFEIPENWVWCKLNDVNIIKWWKRMPMWANFSSFETKYIYIRVSDMKNGTIDKSDLKYIDEEIYKKLKQYNINSTDIYMTIVWATIWKCWLIPQELDWMILTENATKLTPLKVNKKFLYFLFTSSFCQDQFIDKTKQVWVQKMSLERFKNTLIPLPPLEEQKRIVEKIEEFEEKLNKLDKLQTKQLKELEALKNAVLDKALSGELI